MVPHPTRRTTHGMATKKKRPGVDEVLVELHATLRERIQAEADPIGFLTRVVKGEEIGGEVPNLAMRADIALKLTGKILPDMKALELSGEVGGTDVGDTDAYAKLLGKLGRGAPLRPAEETTH